MNNLISDMDHVLRIILLLGTVLYLGVILLLLKKKKLTVRHSIIWLLFGFVLFIFAAVPYVVYVLRDLLHVEMPVNLVFMMIFAFVLLLLLSLSITVSEYGEKIKRLTQENALLEKRLREIERVVSSKKHE